MKEISQLEETKADIRNKLTLPTAVLWKLASGKEVPEKLYKMAANELGKIDKLLDGIKDGH